VGKICAVFPAKGANDNTWDRRLPRHLARQIAPWQLYFCNWPMAEAMAAGRTVRLPGLNLPAASPFVNPDSAHHGPRRKAGGAPRAARCWRGAAPLDVPCSRAAAPGPMPGRDWPRGPRCRHGGERRQDQARQALHREARGWPRHVGGIEPCRQSRASRPVALPASVLARRHGASRSMSPASSATRGVAAESGCPG